jgi:Double zinc ribbon
MEKAKKTTKAAKCACPFCEQEMEVAALPFCRTCGVTVQYCVKCEMPAPRNAKVCPKCGGKLTSR